MLQSSVLIDALSSACWEKKKKREREKEMARVLFSQGRHALLAVPHGFLVPVVCN
jgi:hypothetical protein